MLTALRIIVGYLAVRAGRRERTGRPGVWRVYRKADSIVIEVFHDHPAS
jgi:hypothetical protein